MHLRSVMKPFIAAAFVAAILAVSLSSVAIAGDSILERGMVHVERDGTVVVYLADGTVVVPSNGRGLLEAGHIAPGDDVVVRIVEDNGKKRHKHRGHVTVLK